LLISVAKEGMLPRDAVAGSSSPGEGSSARRKAKGLPQHSLKLPQSIVLMVRHA